MLTNDIAGLKSYDIITKYIKNTLFKAQSMGRLKDKPIAIKL